jgi:serine/threonine-protein kinase
MERAIGYFEQAIARDPTFAEAHAGLASACLMRGLAMAGGLTREAIRELRAKARVSAQHAIEADETVSVAHTVLAAIALMLDWDWPRAEERLRRALELNANSAYAHTYRAMLCIVLERRDDARREIERATELDPMNAATRAEAGEFSFWLRDYDRATAYAAQALAFDPAYPRAHFVLGRVYETQGRIVESIAEYEKAKWSAKWVQGARDAFQRGGRSGFDQWQLSGLLAQGSAVNPMYLARAYTNLGRTNEAIAALERAYQEREPVMCLVKAVEWFEPLHGDPRFIDLARRMRLPQ